MVIFLLGQGRASSGRVGDVRMALSFLGCARLGSRLVDSAAGVGNSHCDTGEYSVSQH